MAHGIDCACHLCQQRGIAIAVARDHLPDTYALCITSKRGSACPAFKGHFLRGRRYCMKMVIKPDRIKAQRLSLLRYMGHCFICLDGIGDANQVHAPALWHNQANFHCHAYTSLLTSK